MPFVIVRGYTLAGVAESSEQYLAYCLAECDWGGVRYAPKTVAGKAKALDEPIHSPKWKGPPGDDERDFLAKHVK